MICQRKIIIFLLYTLLYSNEFLWGGKSYNNSNWRKFVTQFNSSQHLLIQILGENVTDSINENK